MVYPYLCERCKFEFDVVKPHTQSAKSEKCPKCKKKARRVYLASVLMGTATQNAEYNPGLGMVTKNNYHRAEICKKKGLEEIGNEKPKVLREHYAKQREEKRKKAYEV